MDIMTLQEQIRANEIELERMRRELGIKPKMRLIYCQQKQTEPTLNLWDLNKELIAINRNKVSK